MVHQSSKPSKALVWLTAIFLLALTTISGIKIILSLNDSNNQTENPSEQPEEPEEESQPTEGKQESGISYGVPLQDRRTI